MPAATPVEPMPAVQPDRTRRLSPETPYQHAMRRRIELADRHHREDSVPLVVPVCRQTVVDLLDAANVLSGMNPWRAAVAKRLRAIATNIRAVLDEADIPELPEEERTAPK